MQFNYNEEQRMLSDSLRKLIDDNWAFDARRARAGNLTLDQSSWQALAELGITGLLVPVEFDGFGESPATLLATQLELGRGLVAEPVIPSAVISTTVLTQSENSSLRKNYLPKLAEGSAVFALAYLEGNQRDTIQPSETKATASANGYTLSGNKKLVWGGAQATELLVSALVDNELALFVINADAKGLSCTDYPTMDGYHCANISFDAVELSNDALLATGEEAHALLHHGLDYGVAALCAHATGAIEKLVQITIDYLKVRQQFGRPLVEFQVLQHALADMVIQQEQATSMAYVAARSLSEPDIHERRRLLSAAKVAVADAGRLVGELAVQLHGGIGMTAELEVGDYFKRLIYSGYLLGSTDFHLSRVEQG